MFVRRILICALFGSSVLAAPFNHTTGVVNDKQEVNVHDGNRSLVPHGNYTEGAARNVSLYDYTFREWCVIGAQLSVAGYVYYYLMSLEPDPRPAPPAPPAPPVPVVPPEVMRRDSVRCIEVLKTKVNDCTEKRWVAAFGECKCVAMFGSEVANKGTSASGLFQIMIDAIIEDGLRAKNAVVMDFGAGTPHLVGVGVGCGKDWTDLLHLYDHWDSGYGASGADEQKSTSATIVVTNKDELRR